MGRPVAIFGSRQLCCRRFAAGSSLTECRGLQSALAPIRVGWLRVNSCKCNFSQQKMLVTSVLQAAERNFHVHVDDICLLAPEFFLPPAVLKAPVLGVHFENCAIPVHVSKAALFRFCSAAEVDLVAFELLRERWRCKKLMRCVHGTIAVNSTPLERTHRFIVALNLQAHDCGVERHVAELSSAVSPLPASKYIALPFIF